MERMFTTLELAERWGVAQETIRRWILANHLDAIDISGRCTIRPLWRVTYGAVRAFEADRGESLPLLMEDL